jgi:UDP-N-acetyl-2-amino-2-deoxyglucuronate dehydrogenase
MGVNRKRVAVIGLNHYHVAGWVDSLAEFPDRLEIVALYDPDSARGQSLTPDHSDPHLSRRLPGWAAEIPYYTDLDNLIRESRPEIAVVTLPSVAAPLAIERLAAAGVHMLVDKPGARTAADAERGFGAAKKAGVKVAVAFTRRYGQGWKDAKAMVDAGRLGSLIATEAVFVTSSPFVRDPANAIFSRELMGGGILHWLGVHDLDLLLWLTGEPIVEVQAMAGTVSGAAIDVEDVLSMSVRYRSGAIGTVHYAYALPRTGGDGYLALRGTKGSIHLQPNGTLTWTGPGSIGDPVMTQTTTYQTRTAPGYGAGGGAIIDDLLRAIEEDREPLANGDAATEALRVIDAAYRSAAEGRRVRIEPAGSNGMEIQAK